MIETKEQAEEAVRELRAWIGKQPRHESHTGLKESDETESVREWCRQLLETAEADGLYGCPLCMS